jgi:hypothetical protein
MKDNEMMGAGEEDIEKYFYDGYEMNKKFMRIIPTKRYMNSTVRVKWLTLVKTILQSTKCELSAPHICYTKKFTNMAIEVFGTKKGDLLLIDMVKKNELIKNN